MKEFKIDLSMYDGKVREVVSEAVQRKAFELGYGWVDGGKSLKLLDAPLLYLNINGFVTCGYSKTCSWSNSDKAEISAADFLALTPEDVKDAPKEPELKPFDRVLVRDYDNQMWSAHLYSHRNDNLTFIHRTVGDVGYHHCIPYEGNEHLLGTTEDVK